MQPSQDGIDLADWQAPNPLGEFRFVDGHDLRNIDHARLLEVALAWFQQHIPGCLGASQIGGDEAHYGRHDAALVEQIALHYDTGMTFGRGRSGRHAEIDPVDFALANQARQLS